MHRTGFRLSASLRRGTGVTAIALFCLTLVAGADGGALKANEPASSTQSFKGTLTVSGEVTVNGRVVQTGTTVTNGDVIVTGPQADVTVDMEQLGSVRLRPNTSVRLVQEKGEFQLIVDRCGCITQTIPEGVNSRIKTTMAKVVQVAVTDGEVGINRQDSRSGRSETKTLKAGKHKLFRDVSEIHAEGGASYTIQCCQCCFVEKLNPERESSK